MKQSSQIFRRVRWKSKQPLGRSFASAVETTVAVVEEDQQDGQLEKTLDRLLQRDRDRSISGTSKMGKLKRPLGDDYGDHSKMTMPRSNWQTDSDLNLLNHLQQDKHTNFHMPLNLKVKLVGQIIKFQDLQQLEAAERSLLPEDRRQSLNGCVEDENYERLLRTFLSGYAQFGGGKLASNKLMASPLMTASLSCYRFVLEILATEGEYILAAKVLHNLQNSPEHISPDTECFNSVLRACAASADTARPEALETAQNCLAEMTSNRDQGHNVVTQPNSTTYALLLKCWSRANPTNRHHRQSAPSVGQKAYELLQEVMEEPDESSYTLALNLLAMEGNYDLAEKLLARLVENSRTGNPNLPTPNISFIRSVFKAYAQANSLKAAERAELLLRSMERLDHTLQLLDVRVYSTMIAIWSKLGIPERAQKSLEEMEQHYRQRCRHSEDSKKETKPDAICYRTIIGCLSKIEPHTETTARQAEVLLEKMKSMGHSPNLKTCNTVLNCWAKANCPSKARDALERMKTSWGVLPDIVSYNTIIHAYARLGKADEASELLEMLVAANLNSRNSSLPTPTKYTFASMILALSKQKTIQAAERAEALLLQMVELHESKRWDTHPNVVAYNSVLNCWAAVDGGGSRARAILKQLSLLSSSERPTVISYNTVINAQADDLESALEVLQEMISDGIEPNGSTLRTVKKVLGNDPSVSDKEMRWKQIRKQYFSEYLSRLWRRNKSLEQKQERRRRQRLRQRATQ